jgi:receptor expression-enhancing protein 5/6
MGESSFILKSAKDHQKKQEKEKGKEKPKKEPTPIEKVSKANQLDKALEKVPFIVSLSKKHKFSKPIVALILAISVLVFLLILFNVQARVLSNTVTYVYPAYKSLKTIDSGKEYKQWLSYWILLGYLQLCEHFLPIVLRIFPFYFVLKSGFAVWLFLPQTNVNRVY